MILEQIVRYGYSIAPIDALENHAAAPVISVLPIQVLHWPFALSSLRKDSAVHLVRQGHKSLLQLAFTIELLLHLATCPTYDPSTRTHFRFNHHQRAYPAHELPLRVKLSLTLLGWPAGAIIEGHELTLQLFQIVVDQLLPQ